MNRVVLVGRLARDPNELRRSVSGVSAISFTIAVDSRSKQEDHQAEFIPCTAFNKTAEFVDMYFKKGLQVGIDGRLQSRKYEKDGKTVYVVEVVCENVQILEPKGARDNTAQTQPQQNISQTPSYQQQESSEPVEKPSVGYQIEDTELPF